MPLAVALFSGGLDSMLAVRILQEQGFEVEALNIRTPFACCKVPAARAAVDLGIRQTVLGVDDDYVELVRNPRYGRGNAINPCIDCRIHMAKIARRFMDQIGACVVISGEVLNQRPMSQKRNDLEVIALRSGLERRLLRPLSAQLLAPTIPEREGLVNRDRLYAFHGRGRTRLMALAGQLGICAIPQPSTGCALTEPSFAPRVLDLMEHSPQATAWDFELLNIGRHIRLDQHTKAVIGRNATENAALRSFAARDDAGELLQLEPESFVGPDALMVGRIEETSPRMAAALMVHYARRIASDLPARVRVTDGGATRVIDVDSLDVASAVAFLGML
jgi:tRNA-uridine 2-sulfurtransferase